MNSLSIILWISGVSDKVGIVALFATIPFAIYMFIGMITDSCTNESFTVRKPPNWIIGGMIAIISFYMFLPNQTTALLIAASEISEKVISSERINTVIDPATNLINTWLQSETAKLRAELMTNNAKTTTTTVTTIPSR